MTCLNQYHKIPKPMNKIVQYVKYKLGLGDLPFFDDFSIEDLVGAHELGDEVAEHSDEYHHH
jgi:hypothetical protein